MKVLLDLREDVTAARFMSELSRQIKAGDHKAWEVVKARPLQIKHKGRFRSQITLRRPARAADYDVVASITGKDAGLVLRYFAGLIAMKLGDSVAGFYVPLEET